MASGMPKLSSCLLVVVLTVCGCSSKSPTQPSSSGQPSGGSLSAVARSYLDELLGIMQANSINRRTIDWTAFRQSVYAAAGSAQTIQAVTDGGAVSLALTLLGDITASSRSRTAAMSTIPTLRRGVST